MAEIEVHKVLQSNSKGNAILYFDNTLLLDIGVPYQMIEPYVNDIKYVFISHIHTDHFNKSAVKRLANEKPLIKFIVGNYLYQELLDLGIAPHRVVIVKPNTKYRLLKHFSISPIPLYHNVDNMGLKMEYRGIRLIHATDTNTLEHIEAKNYDYYMVEENYDEEMAILYQRRMTKKRAHDYTLNSVENHLSKQALELWLLKNNVSGKGEVVKLHRSNAIL